jgi:hypothetical protein
MLILSISSFIKWIFVKLFIVFCILALIGTAYIGFGCSVSKKMRDRYMNF